MGLNNKCWGLWLDKEDLKSRIGLGAGDNIEILGRWAIEFDLSIHKSTQFLQSLKRYDETTFIG